MQYQMWWIWFALAAIFLIGEIFTAGFFLLWFCIGAAAAAILALLGVGDIGQLVVFILVSGITFVFGRKLAERISVKQPPGIGADRFVGKNGVVIEKIDSAVNTGSVRIGQDEWRATSETGDLIPEGARIKVTRVDGTHAIVKIIEEGK